MNKKTKVYLHGECMVFPSKLPSNAKQKNVKKGSYLIVADSETTGNHHVVDKAEGVSFYTGDKDTLFMEVDDGCTATMRCLHAERHDEIKVGPGCYEFGTQQEYDPFTARLQKVRD
jgi:hypothetical protein